MLATKIGRFAGEVTPEVAFKKLEKTLSDGIFEDVENYRKDLAFEGSTGAKAKKELKEFASGDFENPAEGAAWKKVVDLALKNLSDLTFVQIGPKASDGSLAVDSGAYAYAAVGKAQDGQLVALHFGAVET